jgi:hypothetical protein
MAKDDTRSHFWRRFLLVSGSIIGILGLAFNDVIVPVVAREMRNIFDWGQDVAGTSPVLVENVSQWPVDRFAVSDGVLSTTPESCASEDWVAQLEAIPTGATAYFDLRSRRSDVTVTGLSVQVLEEVPLEQVAIANCLTGGVETESDHFAAYLIGESSKVSQLHSGAAASIGNEEFSVRLDEDPLPVTATFEVDGPILVTWQLVAEYVVDGERGEINIGNKQQTAGQPLGNTEFSAFAKWTEETRYPTRFQRLQENIS